MKAFTISALLIAAVAKVHGAANLLAAVADNDDLSTLEALVLAAEDGTDTAVQNLVGTLFAPVNDAFTGITETAAALQRPYNKDILTQVLTYHLLANPVDGTTFSNLATDAAIETLLTGKNLAKGEGAVVKDLAGNEAAVTPAGAAETNGAYLHTVDKLLLPEDYNEFITAFAGPNLADVATYAGVLEALQGVETGLTLFAPVDAKFENFDKNATSAEDTATILKYHVVPQVITAAGAKEAAANGPVELTTLEGRKITVSVSGEDVLVNGKKVTAPDNRALNGVVHVVEDILAFPETTTPGTTTEPTSAAAASAPATVVLGAGIVAALRNMM